MGHRKPGRRPAVAALVAVAMATIGGLLAPGAVQAEPRDPASDASRDVAVAGGIGGRAATTLAENLGRFRTGGIYLDRDAERLVVTVTDDAAAKAVTSAGGIARKVANSTAYLESVTDELRGETAIPGIAYGVDVKANQVVIDVDSTVTDASLAKLESVTRPHGSAVRINRVAGNLSFAINGGDMINPRALTDPVGNCSLGFNVRKKANPDSLFMLTAGHCTKPTNQADKRDWENSARTYIGYTTGAYLGGNDFGLIRHYNASVDKPGNVDIGGGKVQDITHSRDAYADEYVCASGMRSKHGCGHVTARNVTVRAEFQGEFYTIDGLVRTDICRQPGDSGGPLHHGDAALGILSAAVENCGPSYFQPVNPALAWYGVEVY